MQSESRRSVGIGRRGPSQAINFGASWCVICRVMFLMRTLDSFL